MSCCRRELARRGSCSRRSSPESLGEMRKNVVYCQLNNCKKVIDNAEYHAKQQGEVDFFKELKFSDDPEPFRKYLFAFKRATGGGAPGQGNRQGGSALKLSAPRVARRAVLMA